jgi:hypothetical protein
MNAHSKSIAGTPLSQSLGGFRIVYHYGEPNHCPGCGRQQWIVGRVTAECVFCETALPLEHVSGYGYTPRFGTSHPTSTVPYDLRPLA